MSRFIGFTHPFPKFIIGVSVYEVLYSILAAWQGIDTRKPGKGGAAIIPEYVATCLERLWGAGFAAHPVGGCVRDTLLGRTPGDWDIATSATPEQVSALFPHTVPTGVKHGTVTVVLPGGTIEVTAFRREGAYADGRHPDAVTFGASLEEDLSRRDFTINAMALAPDGQVIDPFGGRADLERKRLRCVGAPSRRFSEDALRILRGIRFAAQLGFTIEEQTAAAMESLAPNLVHVSAERLTAELDKTLSSPAPHWAGEFFRLGAMERFGCPTRAADWSRLAAAEAGLPRWRTLCALTGLNIAALPVPRALRRAVQRPWEEAEKALALTGGDLYALGLRGPAIGAAQRTLAQHILTHPADNTREILLKLLKNAE